MKTRAAWFTAWGALFLAGCVGDIERDPAPSALPGDGPPASGREPAALAPAAPAPQAPVGTVSSPDAFASTRLETYPLLRLSVDQYANIIADVLGDTAGKFSDLLLDPTSTTINQKDLMMGLLEAGGRVAGRVFGPGGRFEKYCAAPGEACARRFVAEVGPLLFRRPLTAGDTDGLLAVFAAAQELGPTQAMVHLLTSMLIAPSFTTVVETPGTGGRLPDEQVAARLGLFLWDSAPDAELMAAAAAGKLRDRAGVEQAAARLMASPRFARVADRFFDGWLDLPAVAELQKAPELKDFTAAVAKTLASELRAFARGVFAGERSDHAELFTGARPLPASLSKLYGESVPGGRRGLLAHPALLSALALPAEPSVAMRGVFVLKNVLCTPPAPPPEDVPPLEAAKVPAGASLREKIAVHASTPVCAACHRSIDGLGLGFENFDAIGRYQDKDAAGRPLTGAGVIYRPDGTQQPFRGVQELSELVARSSDARLCFVNQWFERGLHRKLTVTDARDLGRIAQRFVAGGNMRQLVADYVASDAFVSRAF